MYLGCRMRAAKNAPACTTHPLHNRLRGTRLSAVDVREFLTHERICSASSHLARLSTPWLSVEEFVRGAKESAVLRGLCPYSRCSARQTARFPGGTDGVDDVTARYDVTVLICSYNRVQNLRVIINALMCGRDFIGNVEILFWNNNPSESDAVQCIVRTFATRNSGARFLLWIESSSNYYCIPRLACASLIRSEELLTCDDDILPKSNFISAMMSARRDHPGSVLCTRGHFFEDHEMDEEKPSSFWSCEHHSACPRFVDIASSTRPVHFAHADTCVVPRSALAKAATVVMPPLHRSGRRLLVVLRVKSLIQHLHRSSYWSASNERRIQTLPDLRCTREKRSWMLA